MKINSVIENSNYSPRTIQFDEFSFDAAKRVLWRDGETVSLAPKTCEILAALIENAPQILSKEELMNLVWNDSFVEEANLTHHISALRKALGEDKNSRKFIETIPRKGYRFIAEVGRAANEKSEITITEKTTLRVAEGHEFETLLAFDDAENSSNAAPAIKTQISPARTNNIWKFGAAVCGVLAIGAAVFGFRYFYSPKNNQLPAPPEIKIKRLTPDAIAIAPAVSPSGESVVFSSLENGRESLWRKAVATGEMTQLLPAASTADGKILFTRFSPDGKWIYFSRMGAQFNKQTVFRIGINGGTPQQIIADIETDFSISPDGKFIAFASDFRQLIVADAETGAKRVVFERDGANETVKSYNVSSAAWSPDGSRLVCAGSVFRDNRNVQQLLEVNVQTGAMNLIPMSDDSGAIYQIEWQPDGSGLFITRENGWNFPTEIWRVAYPGGAAVRVSKENDSFQVIRLSADGKTLVAEQKLGGYNIWTAPADNLANKRQITVGAAARQGLPGLAFAPDGEIVYSSFESGVFDLWMMNETGGNRRQLTVNVGKSNISPQPTADGRYLVFSSMRSGTNQIWRMDADGGNPIQLSNGIENYAFSIAPDNTVYYNTFLPDEQKYQVYRVPVTGGKPVKLEDDFYYLSVPFFSPDGKWTLAYGGATQNEPPQIVLIDRAANKVVRAFPKINGTVVRWSPDSKTVLYASDGNQQLWRQPVEGGAPQQITDFYPLSIAYFDVSPDGKQMVFSLGNTTNEIVAVQNFSESVK